MFPSLTEKGDLAKRRDFSPGLSLAFPASRSSGTARRTQGHCRGVGSVGEEGRNPVSMAPGLDWTQVVSEPSEPRPLLGLPPGCVSKARGGPGRGEAWGLDFLLKTS